MPSFGHLTDKLKEKVKETLEEKLGEHGVSKSVIQWKRLEELMYADKLKATTSPSRPKSIQRRKRQPRCIIHIIRLT